MLIDPFVDNHVHTALCHHAIGSMEEYVLSALRNGLRKICFLEHMEDGISTQRITWLTDDDFNHYFDEGCRLRDKYAGSIQIGLGVEVGFNPTRVDSILQRLSQRTWDQVGISYHFHKHQSFSRHLNLVSKRDKNVLNLETAQANELISSYFRNLLKAVTLLPGTIVCHLDAVLRYHPKRASLSLPWDIIEDLLEAIKKNNIAIEINTSGIVMRGEVFPCRSIIQRAVAKKIRFAAGSDAHAPESVGQGFEKLKSLFNDRDIRL